jgi:hypothetical protein
LRLSERKPCYIVQFCGKLHEAVPPIMSQPLATVFNFRSESSPPSPAG